jgi:two-component system, cell cycle sensor histidine kinase and response regulator CckA
MSDIDAPMRYAEPAFDRGERDGGVGLVVLLALALAVAAIGLAMVSREQAEPFVLAILAGLAVIGVFCLFAGAVGILHFGSRAARSDIAKAFVDNLPQGALIADASGRVVYANAAYRTLLGLPPELGLPTPERAFVGNAEIAEHVFRLSRAAQQGRKHSEEFPLSPQGEPAEDEHKTPPRWFRVSVRPIPVGPGSGRKGALTVWQVEEITQDRRRQEDGFAALQAVIGALDEAPAGFFTASGQGGIDYLNSTLAQWLGRDLTEIAARQLPLSEIVSGNDAGLLKQGRGAARSLDIDLRRANGTALPVRLLVSTRGSNGDTRIHALVLNRAAGEVESAAPAELRFARLFNAAPIAIATVNAEGRIRARNAAFARLFGRDASEADAIHLADLIEEGGRETLKMALERALAGHAALDPVDIAFAGDCPRSGRFYLAAVEKAEDEAEAAIVYCIDTTEQRALEIQIAQSQKMQAVGQLAGGIAHDFNNLLTAIIGFSDFLLQSHRPADPAFQDIMNIKQNANRAAGLVRQLLAFSRQQTLRPQVLELGSVLNELTMLLGRLLGEKVELSVDNGRDLWRVKADLHQFEQVIVNLAVNARDSMPEGGKLSVRTANVPAAEVRGYASFPVLPGDYVMIEVRDSGHGMSKEVMEKIFEPFFSTKEVGRGTGLGLSTVYGIIKQTGGYIIPESKEGAGTVMRVFLPRFDESKAPAEAEAESRREAPKDLTGRGTVLLVEDEDAVRSFAARALQQRGYNVLQAATGVEALERFGAHKGEIDLVVSDVVMPEMDGPTLLQNLRAERPDLKIIFISGYAEDSFRKNLSEDEEFTFLQKPFDLKQLAGAVKDVLQR